MKKVIALFIIVMGCSAPKPSNPPAPTLKLQLKLPAALTTRRHELFWDYQLSKGKHRAEIRVLATIGFSSWTVTAKPTKSRPTDTKMQIDFSPLTVYNAVTNYAPLTDDRLTALATFQ